MRVPILAAVAASAALFALAAAAHGSVEDRDDTVVMTRQCALPTQAAVRCQRLVPPPVKERVGRVRRREAPAAWPGSDLYVDHGRLERRDEGVRDMWDDRGRAFAGGAIHQEDEDRRGWDDHQYVQRDGGLWPDSGDAPSRVYRERRGRPFEHGEHWLEDCGCGPARALTAS